MLLAERIAESVARRLSRRRVLRDAAAALFASAAGLAAAGSGVDAARCPVRLVDDTACNLPFLTACTDTDPALCEGSRCSGGCVLDDEFYGQRIDPSCWCTALQREGSPNRYGYWKCCDCRCTQPVSPSPGSPWATAQYPDGTYGCGCRERVTVEFEPVGKPPKPDPEPKPKPKRKPGRNRRHRPDGRGGRHSGGQR